MRGSGAVVRRPRGTVDIDTANNVAALDRACRAARKETRLGIPFGFSSVFDAPYEYESRLQRLRLFVAEKHDWALMKMVRFQDKDLAHFKAASESVGFDLGSFEERFLTEMMHVLPRERFVVHFLAMIEELYGEPESSRLESVLKSHKHWR